MRAFTLVADLPAVERFFLWATRAWAANHMDLTFVWWSLDRAFSNENMSQALIPFDRSMAAIFAGLKRWPDIRCVRCVYLGAQEAQVLNALAALQRRDQFSARAALQDWLQHSAVKVVCEGGRECVALAANAGLHFASTQFHGAASACTRLANQPLIDPMTH